MYKLFSFFSVWMLSLLLIGQLDAQQPEDIITEALPEDGDMQAQTKGDSMMTESSDFFLDDEFIDGVVKESLIHESRLLSYPPLREADVPWQRRMWRIIDIREKMNLPFAYPVKPFISLLLEGITAGELVAFHQDDFKEQMTREEIESKMFNMDTVPIIDPETYETTISVVRNDLNPEDIEQFRIKEVWYFDKSTSRLKNRVLGIAPIKAEYDEAGNFKFAGPMFWIYFPQARKFLSHHRAYVDGNDVAPVTWEHVFEMRKFSSYIFKVTNPLDERLENYPQFADNKMDMLYESMRIKEELFNFEHDLWSY